MKKLSQSSMPFKWKIFGFGILAAASWGLSTVLTKGVLEYVDPLTLLSIQLFCSNIFLWIVVLMRCSPLPSLKQGLRLGLPGLLQPGIAYTFGIVGLSLTSASIESLIWSTESILIIAFAWLLLGEQVGRSLIIFSFFTAFGMILLTVDMSEIATSSYSSLGNLLILVGASCAALYTVLTKKLVTNVHPLLLVTLNQSFGFIGVLAVWSFSHLWMGHTDIQELNLGVWCLVIVSGITLHGLPFWLHTVVLKNMDASLASLFITLIPVFSIGGSYLFLNEKLSSVQWIGTALILLSMVAVSLLHKE